MAATVPAVALVVYQAHASREQAIVDAQEQARTIARVLIGGQQRRIDSTRHFLAELARMPQARQLQSPECSAFLAQLLALHLDYANLGLPQADGTLTCNAKPLPGPVNVADRPYIQRAIVGRAFAVSNFQVDRVTRVAGVNFAMPVFDDQGRDVIGAAVAVCRWTGGAVG